MAADHSHDDLDQRLEQLENRIEMLQADLAARNVGRPGPHYYESGKFHPELDDQAITP